MKRGQDWYKRDPIAFMDAVQGMSPEVIGAYAVIIDLLYARAGETPRDDHHLAGIMGCSTRKAKSLTDTLIEKGKIEVRDGLVGVADLRVRANSRAWLRFLRKETNMVWLLATFQVRLRGNPRLLLAFGKCFP